jgi:hypothetical protein
VAVAAPEYVPLQPLKPVRSYESPPRGVGSWRPDRPGDSAVGYERGNYLGSQGPDQGYIFVLARRFQGQLSLARDEREEDAIAGCSEVALKRASLFGRAPVLPDMTVALTIWGFLGDAKPDLIAFRQPLFAEVANPHHYAEQRRVVDRVPEDALRLTPDEVAEIHRADWRRLLVV